ncbi:hypothetical protein PHET_07435 [Paragonimus heterotremus]|uniref:Uncharacterized protein n=1 Tax=Paragonimus heterotremus TaxID=100268 RepID=A0A8J4T5E6_9TREM|nr:hypothetical protein PHET_07435 [Paragonimus heterotremus]
MRCNCKCLKMAGQFHGINLSKIERVPFIALCPVASLACSNWHRSSVMIYFWFELTMLPNLKASTTGQFGP